MLQSTIAGCRIWSKTRRSTGRCYRPTTLTSLQQELLVLSEFLVHRGLEEVGLLFLLLLLLLLLSGSSDDASEGLARGAQGCKLFPERPHLCHHRRRDRQGGLKGAPRLGLLNTLCPRVPAAGS